MVTYSDLIQIGILIVSICSLVYQICKRKLTAGFLVRAAIISQP